MKTQKRFLPLFVVALLLLGTTSFFVGWAQGQCPLACGSAENDFFDGYYYLIAVSPNILAGKKVEVYPVGDTTTGGCHETGYALFYECTEGDTHNCSELGKLNSLLADGSGKADPDTWTGYYTTYQYCDGCP